MSGNQWHHPLKAERTRKQARKEGVILRLAIELLSFHLSLLHRVDGPWTDGRSRDSDRQSGSTYNIGRRYNTGVGKTMVKQFTPSVLLTLRQTHNNPAVPAVLYRVFESFEDNAA